MPNDVYFMSQLMALQCLTFEPKCWVSFYSQLHPAMNNLFKAVENNYVLRFKSRQRFIATYSSHEGRYLLQYFTVCFMN